VTAAGAFDAHNRHLGALKGAGYMFGQTPI
jgi:hypothetical protein